MGRIINNKKKGRNKKMINKINIFKALSMFVDRHSPEILMGIGISGMITSTIMAIKATPKALMLIEEKKKEVNEESLSKIDIVKTTWKCYMPTLITTSLSALCLIGSNSVSLRRNAAIATAYTLSESALKEYQSKVIDTIGENKNKEIKESIISDKINNNKVQNVVFVNENGDTLCYDTISGRYFKSDRESINKAVNEINKNMIDEMYISLNDFYYELGLENIKIGDDLGWNIENGQLEIFFSSQLANDGTPCLVLDYKVTPKDRYFN